MTVIIRDGDFANARISLHDAAIVLENQRIALFYCALNDLGDRPDRNFMSPGAAAKRRRQ
jgi:hypothetical protein